MTKILQKPDGSVAFDITLKNQEVVQEYQAVLKKVASTAQIKGFRKGKAPLAMVEAQSDQSRLYGEVLDHLLSPAYSKVIHEHKLAPLIEPKVTPKSMKAGDDWVMSVEVAVAPEVVLGDYEKYIKAAKIKHTKDHQPEKKAKQTKEQLEQEQKAHDLNIIFDALLEHAKLEIAPLLIEEETKSALTRLAKQLESLKLSIEDYTNSLKKTTTELVAEYKKTAELNLKLEFILRTITKDKKFEGKETRRQTLDYLTAL